MKRLLLLISVVLITSCNYFENQKVNSKDLLEEELESFSWNDVDEYPSFDSCNSMSGKLDKKVCFENTLRNILNTNLSQLNIVVTEDVIDTIVLKITIDNLGKFEINEIISKAQTKAQIPTIDSLLIHGFDNLPKIYPAIKRSQQVSTQFNLPVIININ
ncbi:hypothetical protein A9Q87_02970 [Flavobacteriales bacterium 34_180_T64]|nr:hypothetical protein A9Q87_02970 [Flavobacteriales bacterium 34_180_T64]